MKNFIFAVVALILGSLTVSAQQTIQLKTIALGDFEYLGNPELKSEFKPLNQMLQSDLVKAKRFQIVERGKMDQVLKEQGLTDTGLIGANAKEFGSLVGADYTIYGCITDTQQNTETTGNENRFTITVDLNIIDNATGDIKLSDDIEITGFGTLKNVIRQTVEELSRKIIFSIYPVTVAANVEGTLMLNYGRDYIDEGTFYDIFTQGRVIIDPATGLVLAKEEKLLGTIQVNSAHAKFSKAIIIHSEGLIEAGMVCRPSKKQNANAGVNSASKNSELSKGALTVAVGNFIYSNELDLRQNVDRSRSVETHAPTKSGGILGFGKNLLIGESGSSSSKPQPQPTVQTQNGYVDPNKFTKKSDSLREMIITRLIKTGQFDVLERSRMEEINREIDTISSGGKGFFQQEKLGKIKLESADYLIHGTITRLSEDIHNTTRIERENTVILNMTVELRIVEIATGKIMSADVINCSVETSKKGVNFLGLIGTAREQGGAMGELMEASAYSIVSKITTSLRPITIIDINNATGIAMVNYGEGIVDISSDYSVFAQGKEIRDPYSGNILGKQEQFIGTGRPIEVASKFSKLKIVPDKEGNIPYIQVGMICRPSQQGRYNKGTISRPYQSRSTGSKTRTKSNYNSQSRPKF